MFFVVLCLGACSSTPRPEGKPLPLLTFAHLDPVAVDVGALKTQNEEDPVSESFVVSPYRAIEDYLHSRFTPKGFRGVLHAFIEEASVVHSYEPSQNKLGEFLDVAGQDVYDMTITLRLENLGEDERVAYGTVLTVRRLVRVSEHASIAERERRQLQGLEFLFKDIDSEVLRIVLSDMRLGMAG